MKPSELPASRTGQCRACCGSNGRVPSRLGLRPTPGRRELGKRRTSMDGMLRDRVCEGRFCVSGCCEAELTARSADRTTRRLLTNISVTDILRRLGGSRMRRLVLGVVVVVSSVVAIAQQRPDFSGEWKLNRQASVLQAESAVVESGAVRITHRDPAFQFWRSFTVNGQAMTTDYEIATDGREIRRSQGPASSRSRLEWQGNSLLLIALIDTPRGEVSNIARYELIDGGRTLRIIEDLGGAAPVHHHVWIFDRQ